MPTIACQRVRSTILLVHGPSPPTQSEWDKYVALVDSSREGVTRVLVDTAGGAPNATQRAEVQQAYNKYPNGAPPVAVLSESMIARGVVTAFSWAYGRDRIRAFAPVEFDAALDWLAIDKSSADDIRRAMSALKHTVTQE
jgi:hypothetical protein